jgi:hypothetical protein
MTDADKTVDEFIDGIKPAKRRLDARTLLDMMRRITGEEPRRWGTIIGFGNYHYKYESGREGDSPSAAFAPRKPATVIYLPDGLGAHTDRLQRLGPHKTGVGCLYLKDLEELDMGVLEEIITASHARLSADTYGLRAREGGRSADPTA